MSWLKCKIKSFVVRIQEAEQTECQSSGHRIADGVQFALVGVDEASIVDDNACSD